MNLIKKLEGLERNQEQDNQRRRDTARLETQAVSTASIDVPRGLYPLVPTPAPQKVVHEETLRPALADSKGPSCAAHAVAFDPLAASGSVRAFVVGGASPPPVTVAAVIALGQGTWGIAVLEIDGQHLPAAVCRKGRRRRGHRGEPHEQPSGRAMRLSYATER